MPASLQLIPARGVVMIADLLHGDNLSDLSLLRLSSAHGNARQPMFIEATFCLPPSSQLSRRGTFAD